MITKHENSCSIPFADFDDIRAKGNAFTSTMSINAKHPKNLFFVYLNISTIRNKSLESCLPN